MINKVNDELYSFNTAGKTIEVGVLKNGSIEIYEDVDPAHTGFILDNTKQFVALINNLADIADILLEEINED